MNRLEDLLWNAGQVVRTMCQLLRYAFTFLLALLQPKIVLAARLLAAESQLAICKHRVHQKKDLRPRFTPGFRCLWVILSKCLPKWQDSTHMMRPATVKLAPHGLSSVLAAEITRTSRQTGNQQRNADPYPQAQQGESLMGR